MATLLSFEDWYDIEQDELQDRYIRDTPEEFPTDEEMADIENNVEYQRYVYAAYEDYYAENS